MTISLAPSSRRFSAPRAWLRAAWPWLLLLLAAYVVVPWIASAYLIDALLIPFLALSLAAVGLNLLTGYVG